VSLAIATLIDGNALGTFTGELIVSAAVAVVIFWLFNLVVLVRVVGIRKTVEIVLAFSVPWRFWFSFCIFCQDNFDRFGQIKHKLIESVTEN
jgi:hypothetical protein